MLMVLCEIILLSSEPRVKFSPPGFNSPMVWGRANLFYLIYHPGIMNPNPYLNSYCLECEGLFLVRFGKEKCRHCGSGAILHRDMPDPPQGFHYEVYNYKRCLDCKHEFAATHRVRCPDCKSFSLEEVPKIIKDVNCSIFTNMREAAKPLLTTQCKCGHHQHGLERCLFCDSTKVRYVLCMSEIRYLFCWSCYCGLGLKYLSHSDQEEASLYEIWSWINGDDMIPAWVKQ